MKIYVAGKTHDIQTVRLVQKLCRINHHDITHDWTAIVEEVGGAANEHGVPPETQQRYAYYDLMGVYNCDLLIACGHPNVTGTLIEVGAALAWNRPVWLYNWHLVRQTVFQHLDNVKNFGSDLEAIAKSLGELDPVLLATRPAKGRILPDGSYELF